MILCMRKTECNDGCKRPESAVLSGVERTGGCFSRSGKCRRCRENPCEKNSRAPESFPIKLRHRQRYLYVYA